VFKPRMPTYLGLCGQKSKRLVGREEEAVTEVWGCLSCEVNTPGRRGPGWPWGGRRRPRSPCAGLPQALVEAEMLVLPIRRTNFNRRTGVKSLKGERFQFLHSQLVRTNKALQVSFDG
jgi:hypothetical protein